MKQDDINEMVAELARELRREVVPTVREMQDELDRRGITASVSQIHAAYKKLKLPVRHRQFLWRHKER
jgi:hypothetical protein